MEGRVPCLFCQLTLTEPQRPPQVMKSQPACLHLSPSISVRTKAPLHTDVPPALALGRLG